MDTASAFLRGELARRSGAKLMVFDWDKAARRIKESGCRNAEAGLAGDWGYTGGNIFKGGIPNMESYTYLASLWATPELELDGQKEDCFVMQDQKPEWSSDTKWPESALSILKAN